MRKIYLFIVLAAAFGSSCTKKVECWGKGCPVKPPAQLVINGDFERPVIFTNPPATEPWTFDAYIDESAVFTWGKNIGRNNSGGISLDAGNVSNDMFVLQKISLDPSKYYRMSAWVRTENVAGGPGANICLFGGFVRSQQTVTGTSDWQQLVMDIPPNSGEVTIGCRLGFFGATSTGKAWFDNVMVEEVQKFIKTGQHLRLVLDQEDVTTVKPATIDNWVSNLDKAYSKYRELMGGVPYNGDIINILSVADYPGGWAVAGNPIAWYKPYVKGELETIQSTGTWSFGIMHEIGHDFVLDSSNKNWIFNEEMWANFRMYYVAEKLNATIAEGKTYHGAELANYYKTDADGSYDKGIAKGVPQGYDGLMYTLIRIKDKIGWKPFQQVIKDLNASTVTPATNWDRFNLFLDKLTFYSGQDVRTTYLSGELDTIRQLTLNG